MHPIIVVLPGHEPLASRLALRLGAELVGPGEVARAAGREAVVVGALARPEIELVPLLLTSREVRRHGAREVLLVAPRVDSPGRGDPGAGALRATLGRHFEGVVTVQGGPAREPRDRWRIAAAGPALTGYLREQVAAPFIVAAGDLLPWMEELAETLGSPLFGAARLAAGLASGSRGLFWERTPVVIAETVGSGRGMARVAAWLRRRGAPPSWLVVIHADFAQGSAESLAAAGFARLVSTNTLLHPSNRVDVSEAIAEAVWALWDVPTARIETATSPFAGVTSGAP
jgi:ribose-phosphate pyrophosphokinase